MLSFILNEILLHQNSETYLVTLICHFCLNLAHSGQMKLNIFFFFFFFFLRDVKFTSVSFVFRTLLNFR